MFFMDSRSAAGKVNWIFASERAETADRVGPIPDFEYCANCGNENGASRPFCEKHVALVREDDQPLWTPRTQRNFVVGRYRDDELKSGIRERGTREEEEGDPPDFLEVDLHAELQEA